MYVFGLVCALLSVVCTVKAVLSRVRNDMRATRTWVIGGVLAWIGLGVATASGSVPLGAVGALAVLNVVLSGLVMTLFARR